MSALRVSSVAFSIFLFACGDDGGGGGTESEGSSGSDTGTTVPDPTNAATTTPATTADDTTTSGGGSEEEGSGNGSGEGSGGSGDSGGGTADGGSETGAAGPCGELTDMKSCTADKACLWLGNMQNGTCVDATADACAALDVQQACNMHPLCAWDNAAGTCGPA